MENMRLRTLIFALLAVLLAAPAAAQAKPSVGISDNRAAMLVDPLFAELGTKQARIVVSWNALAASERGDNEFQDKVVPYLANASVQGVKVHVSFEHARGEPVNCSSSEGRGKSQCKLPSVAAYKQEITNFLTATAGTVESVTAWNESNHNTQPTYNNPKRAGQFAKAADQVCKQLGTCFSVAMDILDAASNPKATKNLNYSRTIKYIKKLRKAYGKSKPARCGIHNYADVNRFRTSGTKALGKAMKCKSVWLTETGGFYNFASFWQKSTRKQYKCKNSSACQVKAMKYLFAKTIKATKKIDRVYVYNFYSGPPGTEFDAGIVSGNGTDIATSKKRAVFAVVKKHV